MIGGSRRSCQTYMRFLSYASIFWTSPLVRCFIRRSQCTVSVQFVFKHRHLGRVPNRGQLSTATVYLIWLLTVNALAVMKRPTSSHWATVPLLGLRTFTVA